MATEEKYHQIPGIVKALGDILRISINSREALIPIKQEIEYTRGYLVIQRARFGTRLNVQMDIGEEMMEIKIPAFSLQPLVENSVKYAMEQVSTPCRIRIFIKEMKMIFYALYQIMEMGWIWILLRNYKVGILKLRKWSWIN